MNLNQPSLCLFEEERNKNHFLPPAGSNSFYKIGIGTINLLCKRNNPNDYRFELFTKYGTIETGNGEFFISGEISDCEFPYENLTVIKDTRLSITDRMTISKGKLQVYGELELTPPAKLNIRNHAEVVFHPSSTLIINESTDIFVEPESSLMIYGKIKVHISRVDSILNVKGITLDSAAIMDVDGLQSLDRKYSLTDYNTELMKKIINPYTQGEKNFKDSRIGYKWLYGDIHTTSQVIQLEVLWGVAVLGDFKLSILGTPLKLIPELQIISSLMIQKRSTLYITPEYEESKYIRPELYLGEIIGNYEIPGICEIYGTMIVDGMNSFLTLDRGGKIIIHPEGKLIVRNQGIIKSTYNENIVIEIYGTLEIDYLEQLEGFTKDQILFGKDGKVIIHHPDDGKKRILFSTPDHLNDSLLYQLFEDHLDQVEVHMNHNCGITIDRYYQYYNREMIHWYHNMRIEKAIQQKLLIWNGGFIELNKEIIPWVTPDSTLIDASRLFQYTASFDQERLQEVVNHLKYAGSGNIEFRFVHGDTEHFITLHLETIDMKTIYHHPMSQMYTLITSNDGMLFLRDELTNSEPDNIIHENARQYQITDKKVEFQL